MDRAWDVVSLDRPAGRFLEGVAPQCSSRRPTATGPASIPMAWRPPIATCQVAPDLFDRVDGQSIVSREDMHDRLVALVVRLRHQR